MTEFKPGEKVSWNSPGGHAHGTVKNKQTSETRIKGHKVAASPEEPQYIVETAKGAMAAHKPEALKKDG